MKIKQFFTDNYERPDPHKVLGSLFFIVSCVYLFLFKPDPVIIGVLVSACLGSFGIGAVNDKPTQKYPVKDRYSYED